MKAKVVLSELRSSAKKLFRHRQTQKHFRESFQESTFSILFYTSISTVQNPPNLTRSTIKYIVPRLIIGRLILMTCGRSLLYFRIVPIIFSKLTDSISQIGCTLFFHALYCRWASTLNRIEGSLCLRDSLCAPISSMISSVLRPLVASNGEGTLAWHIVHQLDIKGVDPGSRLLQQACELSVIWARMLNNWVPSFEGSSGPDCDAASPVCSSLVILDEHLMNSPSYVRVYDLLDEPLAQ